MWRLSLMKKQILADTCNLYAVIGVWHRESTTYYVKRSEKMENYPGLWSLFSIQYQPEELPDPEDLTRIEPLMQKMSKERLCGQPVTVKSHLIAGDSDNNSIDKHVFLHLYEIEFGREPDLNPDYYEVGEWLSPEEYEHRSAGKKCGLCLRLWSDYAWLAGLTDRPFITQEI